MGPTNVLGLALQVRVDLVFVFIAGVTLFVTWAIIKRWRRW